MHQANRLPWLLFAAWEFVALIGVVVISLWVIQSGRRLEASQLTGPNDPNPTLVFALTAIAAQASEAARMTEGTLSAHQT
jgi:hypothetical protein